MEYLVVGPDGQEYGPASVDTLKQWVAENRLGPTTMLRNFQTSQVVEAGTVPGLFSTAPPPTSPYATGPVTGGPVTAPQAPTSQGPYSQGAPGAPSGNWAQPPSAYPRQQSAASQQAAKNYGGYDSGVADIWWAIGRAVAAVVFFYIFNGIGLIFAVYGVISAFRAQSKGHKFAPVAIGISILALVAVGLGWILKLSGSHTQP